MPTLFNRPGVASVNPNPICSHSNRPCPVAGAGVGHRVSVVAVGGDLVDEGALGEVQHQLELHWLEETELFLSF